MGCAAAIRRHSLYGRPPTPVRRRHRGGASGQDPSTAGGSDRGEQERVGAPRERHGNAAVAAALPIVDGRVQDGAYGPLDEQLHRRSRDGNTGYTQACEDIIYTMTVAAYSDSREASLGEAPMGGAFEATPPGTGRTGPETQIDWAKLEAERKQREAPEAVSWNDLVPAFRRSLSRAEINSGQRFTMPRYIKVRGTVSAVELRQHPINDTTNVTVAEINLRESPLAAGRPYPEFNVCTTRLDVLQETFGADFRTSMIGKTIEVQGRPIGVCWGQAGEIEFGLARQVRPVESAQFAAGTLYLGAVSGGASGGPNPNAATDRHRERQDGQPRRCNEEARGRGAPQEAMRRRREQSLRGGGRGPGPAGSDEQGVGRV